MPTRNVVLTESQAHWVEQLVSSGRYQNASEVLRDGLRLVQAREETQAAKLAALRVAVAVGIEDIEAGRYTEFSDATSLRSHIQGIGQRVRAKRP
jgi:antitoxin ParD1/3/4